VSLQENLAVWLIRKRLVVNALTGETSSIVVSTVAVSLEYLVSRRRERIPNA
jgi:hypothetical protein